MFPGKVEPTVETIISSISELSDDSTVPKNVKEKVHLIIDTLKSDKMDVSMKIDKALQLLDEISEDSNLQSYTRTQVWNLVSMLEKLKF
jgi:uncharacterized protein